MFLTPVFATHPRPPGGFPIRFSPIALSPLQRTHAWSRSQSPLRLCELCVLCANSDSFLRLSTFDVFDLSPFFSQSCKLLCAAQNVISFVFRKFRTLCAKHRGWA